MYSAPFAQPLLSVVIEGYNESLSLGWAGTVTHIGGLITQLD
jgi:hypothetical protein